MIGLDVPAALKNGQLPPPSATGSSPGARPRERSSSPAQLAVGALAFGAQYLILRPIPGFGTTVLAQGAARLAALGSGSIIYPTECGYAVPNAAVPLVVTSACSAADFCCLLAALLAWNFARRRLAPSLALVAGVALATPLTVAINAVRVISVAQVHRWVIPHLPPAFAAFLHLATGVAVFLPALILTNLAFAFYARRPRPC